MYHHEFQNGVPYFLQWAGPLFAYEQLSIERHLPGAAVIVVDGGSDDDSATVAQRHGARVELREWTKSGTMRAPSFKGLRNDKDPQECVREEGQPCDTQ